MVRLIFQKKKSTWTQRLQLKKLGIVHAFYLSSSQTSLFISDSSIFLHSIQPMEENPFFTRKWKNDGLRLFWYTTSICKVIQEIMPLPFEFINTKTGNDAPLKVVLVNIFNLSKPELRSLLELQMRAMKLLWC